MDIAGAIDLDRLRQAKEYSYRKLQVFREKRMAAIREFVGFHYSDDGSSDREIINLLEMAISIYSRHLVSQSPRALVTSRVKEYKPTAASLEIVLNMQLQDMRLDDALREAVINALFGIGIVKVGISVNERASSLEQDAGLPFVSPVDADDWVHDMTAQRWDQIQFAGNRYRLPLELVRQSSLYDPKATAKLQALDNIHLNEGGDERVLGISTGMISQPDTYMDQVELWDIWLPHDRLLVTIPDDDLGVVLRVVEWTGPDRGPYHHLSFVDVPGNIMPLPPVANWMDLHELANSLFRKMGRQALRQKTILGVQAEAREDGQRIIQANDGEVMKMDHPEGSREYSFGGVDQQTLAFSIMLKDLFVYMGGNLDALGGLSPQAETFKQDQLLSENASKRISEMQDRTMKFTKDIVEDLGWYLWNDPVRNDFVEKKIPGVPELAFVDKFGPEDRKGSYFDYIVNIEPYSMVHRSPAQRLQTLLQTWNSFLLPSQQMLQAQGMSLDVKAVIDIIKKYSDMPELDDVIIYAQPMATAPEPEPGAMAQPPITHHTTERINRPGRTRRAADFALTQALMGKGIQQPEAEAVMRPTG